MKGTLAAGVLNSDHKEDFPKRRRLLTPRDFQATLRQGWSVRRGDLLVAVRKNGLEFSRLGIAVGKAVGGAVVRNRAKRCVREVFRRRADMRLAGLDVVIVVRGPEVLWDLARVVDDLFSTALRSSRT